MDNQWQRFRKYFFCNSLTNLQLDISRVHFPDRYFDDMETIIQGVYTQIQDLENGSIANPDENRRVGHYWLSTPEICPDQEIASKISEMIFHVKKFAQMVHDGTLKGERGQLFKHVLVIGIGGSSLGTHFVSDALEKVDDPCKLYFIDNTDPDGMDRIFERLSRVLDATLTIIISKSGSTVETRNGMEEVRRLYQHNRLDFVKHAISVTQSGSQLDQIRTKENWLDSFPMWDWVGGRTSVLSAVGLLPLALQGIGIDQLLLGAATCNALTRKPETMQNPAALLALTWFFLTRGEGGKQMVILPYKDRLELFPRYLQQLIMESLGKETDLDGNVVHQGITVLGNKGTTDQHSYLQQLLDGPDNAFVTFIEVLKDREEYSPILAENSTSGDFLHAFLLGTRKALTQKGRQSITITIPSVTAESIGVLIALFERAVSHYAYLVNVNAYNQPAVEIAKKGAQEVIELKNYIKQILANNTPDGLTLDDIADEIQNTFQIVDKEMVYKILQHLAANKENKIKKVFARDEFSAVYFCSHRE
ncbi:glucose-6-phosphate isomerase [Dehalobacter sp. DCM]|uniref:glucose-6-phosphate isomerase n=1 Tax=Dehalobacter sp. DCM TaxID=2907827 RepID=UPI0030813426|nr:glucose-6-phosphate isomerase [Dehalobacter sp. DCM]